MSAWMTAIERRPQAVFAVFLAVHFAVWTLLPALLYLNLPLDLIEALTYGREWQLGYDKLPPLPWWLVEIMHRLFGADAAYYALAQAAVVVAFAAVWATARPLVGARGALVAVLIIDGMHYFQYTAVKFNHDVIQLPFWALAGYAFHAGAAARAHLTLAAVRLRRRRGAVGEIFRRRAGDADGAVPAVRSRRAPRAGDAGAVARARRRAHRHGAAPRLAGADRFPAVRLCRASAPRRVRGWYDHIMHPAIFTGSQFFFLLPSFFIAAALLWPRSRTAQAADCRRRASTAAS